MVCLGKGRLNKISISDLSCAFNSSLGGIGKTPEFRGSISFKGSIITKDVALNIR